MMSETGCSLVEVFLENVGYVHACMYKLCQEKACLHALQGCPRGKMQTRLCSVIKLHRGLKFRI